MQYPYFYGYQITHERDIFATHTACHQANYPMHRINRESLERAARLYKTNTEASLALGMHPTAFGRACRRYGHRDTSREKAEGEKARSRVRLIGIG